MKHSLNNGLTLTDKENKMAPRKKAGITGSSGKNVDPLYNRSFPPNVSTYPNPNLTNLIDIPKWGAGASSKSKPVKRK
jgi:hypothetical protein